MVGAIFLGEKPGRGYDIQLKESQAKADKWLVKYRVVEPAIASNDTTNPFLIFLLPKTSRDVVFTKE